MRRVTVAVVALSCLGWIAPLGAAAVVRLAPVSEFGGRIQWVADRPMPHPVAARESAGTKVAEIMGEPPGAVKIKRAEAADISPVDALPRFPGITAAQLPGLPPADGESRSTPVPLSEKVGSEAANAVTHPDAPKREVNAAADTEGAVPAHRPAGISVTHPPDRSEEFFTIMSASALALIAIFLVAFAVMMRRKPGSARPPRRGTIRVTYEDEPVPLDPNALAETCRELMKQVTSELVMAMSAVNGLKGAPALQTALHAELDSIRRSVGFTTQTRAAGGEKKDWNQIKTQLTLGLEGTQRIIGIAEAARTSFSAHPAALEVITTRLEAYAFLGINASSSETAVKKAVNALRQCWHPDLATDEEDRILREIRIKQINVAWDLISRKQMSAC